MTISGSKSLQTFERVTELLYGNGIDILIVGIGYRTVTPEFMSGYELHNYVVGKKTTSVDPEVVLTGWGGEEVRGGGSRGSDT